MTAISAPRLGLGIDIEAISRFAALRLPDDQPFLHRAFTAAEVSYCFEQALPGQHLAARWAAKEAIIKALCSLGYQPVNRRHIAIQNSSTGVPVASLPTILSNLTVTISLSHGADYAVAAALIHAGFV